MRFCSSATSVFTERGLAISTGEVSMHNETEREDCGDVYIYDENDLRVLIRLIEFWRWVGKETGDCVVVRVFSEPEHRIKVKDVDKPH